MTRKFTMSPIEPRTAGTLKGFGFTVTWGDEPATTAAAGGDGAGASVSTDTQSTAARKDVQGQGQHEVGESPRGHAGAGTQAPPVDTPPKPVNDDFPRIQVIGSIR